MYKIYSKESTNYFYKITDDSDDSDEMVFESTIEKLFNSPLCSCWNKSEFQNQTSEVNYLFSCNSYEDAYKNYPEYFI